MVIFFTTNIEYTMNTRCIKWESTICNGWLPRIMILIQNDITLNPPYKNGNIQNAMVYSSIIILTYRKAQNLVCPLCHIHMKELHFFMSEPMLKPMYHNTSKNQCSNPNMKGSYKIRRSQSLYDLLE